MTTTRILRTAAAIAMMLPLAACFEHTYDIGSGGRGGVVVYDSWRHHWLGGLIDPDHNVRLREICPSGNATVRNEVTFLNGLVAGLTGGIYSPTTVKIRCQREGRGELDLSAEEVEFIVMSQPFRDRVAVMLPSRVAEVDTAQQDQVER